MPPCEFCELSVEQEEYLVELLCTRGACAFDLFVRELDALCRQSARGGAHSSTSPSSVADCASSSSLSLK
jgi:hypothetical protein